MSNQARTARYRGAPLAVVYLALATWFTWPILSTGAALGISDWDPLLFLQGSVLKSAIEYGQWPFWNPWYCGGDVLWQNPQVPLVTPVYPLALLIGLVPAMKVTVWLHYVVGLLGMHVLLRSMGLRSRTWVLFLAVSVTFGGGAALHIAVGHVTFISYFYLPWILFFVIRCVTAPGWRPAIGTAALFALTLWNGGTHLAFMTALATSCVLGVAALHRRMWRPLGALVIIGGLTVLFAAPKLVPVLAFLRQPALVDIRYFPPQPDAFSGEMLAHALLDPFQHHRLRFPGQNYQWHEYGNYFGNLGALLVIASIVWGLTNRPHEETGWLRVTLAVTAVVIFGLALGEFAPWAPYSVLRRLPVFSQFRLPSRYLLVFTPVALLLVGVVVRALEMDRVARHARTWMVLVLLLATGFVAWRNSTLLRGAFPLKPLEGSFSWMSRPPAPRVDPQTDGFSGNSPMLRALMENRAVLRCNEPLQLPGAIDPNREIVFSDNDAQISQVSFSPNRIEFRALVGSRGARVFMNQRYSPGWTTRGGSALAIDPATKLAYMSLSPGAAGRYELRFVPPGLLTGWILFAVGMAVAVWLWRPRPARASANSVLRHAERQS